MCLLYVFCVSFVLFLCVFNYNKSPIKDPKNRYCSGKEESIEVGLPAVVPHINQETYHQHSIVHIVGYQQKHTQQV